MFSRGSIKIVNNELRRSFRSLVRAIKNASNLFKSLSKIQARKILLYQMAFFKSISIKTKGKYERLGRATEKMIRTSKKIATRTIIKGLGLREVKLSHALDNLFHKKLLEAFRQIDEDVKQKKALKLSVSQKIKGKILMSIQRHENKPINIRKTFLNWYLKSHEENYSKKIYNIWLNGNISKFTFLMRIKNFINDGRKQKIRH